MFPYSNFYNHLNEKQRTRVDKFNLYLRNLKNIDPNKMDGVDKYFTSDMRYDDVIQIHSFIIDIDLPDNEDKLGFFEKFACKLNLQEHLDEIYRKGVIKDMVEDYHKNKKNK